MRIEPATNQQHWRTCDVCGRTIGVLESHRHLNVIASEAMPKDQIFFISNGQIVGRIVDVRA